MMKNKDEIAKFLAKRHSEVEESILKIIRLHTPDEEKEKNEFEPIKLLEVNPDTVSSGIMPVFFGSSEDIPYSSVIIEVTEDEYKDIEKKKLVLPENWKLGNVLMEKKAV